MAPRPPKKSESLEIRLPHATKAAFMQACRSRGVSASDVLRASIHGFLDPSDRAPTRQMKERPMIFAFLRRRVALGAVATGTIAAAAIGLAGPARAAVDPRLAALFDWIDRDHDGRVSGPEFTASMAVAPPLGGVAIVVDTIVPPPPGETREALFRRLDADGDQALTLAELAAAASVHTELSPAAAAADLDANGRLTEGELAVYLVGRRAAAGISDPAAGADLMAHGIIAAHDPGADGAVPLAGLVRG